MSPKFTFLIAEDNESDFALLQRAFRKNNINNPIQWLQNGEEVIKYLQGTGIYRDRNQFPFPELMILDLKMPRMNGIEVLEWLDEHPNYRVIPTIIMSSSMLEADIKKAYELGANTYFVKPADFNSLVTLVKGIYEYWTSGTRPITNQQ